MRDRSAAHAEPAPFGHARETQLDPTVRHAFRLVARGDVEVIGFDPAPLVAEIVRVLSPRTHLAAPLTNVLVYPSRVRAGCTSRSIGYGVQTGYSNERKSTAQCFQRETRWSIFARGAGGGLCWGDSGGALVVAGTHQIAGVLADFNGRFRCNVGNDMIFTSLWGARRLNDRRRGAASRRRHHELRRPAARRRACRANGWSARRPAPPAPSRGRR